MRRRAELEKKKEQLRAAEEERKQKLLAAAAANNQPQLGAAGSKGTQKGGFQFRKPIGKPHPPAAPPPGVHAAPAAPGRSGERSRSPARAAKPRPRPSMAPSIAR